MDHKKTVTSLLKKLVAIPSKYPDEQQIADFIFTYLSNRGITVSKQIVEKNRYNIVAEKGVGERSILFYGHLDTIAVTDGWKTDPFKLIIRNDRAYGLGAWDMKSGLVANIVTFLNTPVKHTKLKLAFCVDEENISKGGYHLIKTHFFKDVVCLVSPEPSFKHKLQGIVTGRVGRAPYIISIQGIPKHFGYYDEKCDPSLFTADLIQNLRNLNKSVKEKKQFIYVNSISTQRTGLSTPSRITLEIDTSVLPPTEHQDMKQYIESIVKEVCRKYNGYFSVSVEYVSRETPFLEGYQIKASDPYLPLLTESIRKITHKKAQPYFRSSVADDNIFGSAGVSTLGIGPVGGNAHAPNEWVSLSSVYSLYNILQTFILLADQKRKL